MQIEWYLSFHHLSAAHAVQPTHASLLESIDAGMSLSVGLQMGLLAMPNSPRKPRFYSDAAIG